MEVRAEHLQLLLTLTDEAAPLWQIIGVELGFTYGEISVIASKPLLIPEGAQGYYREMIAQWLQWAAPNHPLPTVEALSSALRKTGREELALRIESEKDAFPPSKVIKLTCGDTFESSPSASPPVPLPLPTQLEKSQPGTVEPFDMISALQGAGVPHITQQILCYLDARTLLKSELVSTLWRDIIEALSIWKLLVQQDVKNRPLWRSLFERRGWLKYLDIPLSKQMPSHIYPHLYHSACRDIQSLEANWRRGRYTLTRVETGSEINCMQCDDKRIVTGHKDSTVKIWDRSTMQVLKVLKGHKDRVSCLQYSDGVVVSSSRDHTVKVWDVHSGQVINELHHKAAVSSLKLKTDTLVTGCVDGTVAVWNIKSPTDITLRMTLNDYQGSVIAVDMSETNIISAPDDDTVKVWDKVTGEEVYSCYAVSCLQVQGSHLISGHYVSGHSDSESSLSIWSFESEDYIRMWNEHDDWVTCVAVDNKRIVSGDYDGTIKVWDLAAALDAGSSSGTLCITTLKEDDIIKAVQCDDFQVISCSENGALLIYDFLDLTLPIVRI